MRYILIALLLTGCNTVGWGKKHQVTFANPQTVSIKYDTIIQSYEGVAGIAQEHCMQYGKDAVPSNDPNQAGLIVTQNFECR